MSKVYLAGKIEKNCWRHDIVPHLRGVSNLLYDDSKYYLSPPTRWEMMEYFKNIELSSISKNLFISGPFFISNDHGSYHTKNNLHALGSETKYLRYYINGSHSNHLSGENVKEICLHQISKSDYVFCWLDEKGSNPFGTIYELGYAKSLNKKIVICFSSIFAMQKYKEILSVATHIFIANNAKNGFTYLSTSLATNTWEYLKNNKNLMTQFNTLNIIVPEELHVLPIHNRNFYKKLNISTPTFFSIISEIEELLKQYPKIEFFIDDNLESDLLNELIEVVQVYPTQLKLNFDSLLSFMT